MMSERPPAVRIDDLADPTFPPHIAEMMRAVEPLAADLSFTPEALLDAARAESGLDDFGDDWFREPLGVVLRNLDEHAGLSAFGRMSAYTQMVGHMRNRLRVEHLMREHPTWPVIDVTRKAVEETAATILRIMNERGLERAVGEVGQL